MSKDREPRIDGRTPREIRRIALTDQISKLTNKQYDYYNNEIAPSLYGRKAKKDGGMVKGYSKIARPQRFRGIF